MAADTELKQDLRTLALFIRVYCREKHGEESKRVVHREDHDLRKLAGRPVALCPECAKLLAHSFYKRTNCPMQPKPACKRCPCHCYHPKYRARIREVMRFSSRRLVLDGRLDLLFHLVF